MTSRKTVIATWTPWTVVSRSSLMSLIITFMLEPAKLQMNWARARAASARPCPVGRAGLAVSFTCIAAARVLFGHREAVSRRMPVVVVARAGLCLLQLLVECHRRGDEGEMGERLGEVAE